MTAAPIAPQNTALTTKINKTAGRTSPLTKSVVADSI